jgi:transcriptional regulator with XRE-family HTH domain
MKKLSAFARNVRGLRQEFGFSTEEFSQIMDISVSTLGNWDWERGNAVPHVSHIEDLVNFAFENGKKYGYDYFLGLNFEDSRTLNQYSIGSK